MAIKPGRSRLPGVDVDHQALRRARLAAGLSLKQVAGDELSRTAVHRVETGKVRPSMPTLELIARRLGAPADSFLAAGPAGDRDLAEQHLQLLQLQRWYADKRYAEVIAEARRLMDRIPGGPPRGRLQYLSGIAHVQLNEPLPALGHFRQARQIFEAAQDAWMVVECMGWEAAALATREDQRAVDVALEALRRCRELRPVPYLTESRILGHLAGIYLGNHDWERAVDAYERALEAAGETVDLTRLVNTYDGLNVAYQGLGDLTTAAAYAHKALTLSSVSANQLMMARMENNLGVLLLRRRRWQEAELHLRRALAHCETGGIEQSKSHVLLSLAQLEYMRENLDGAELFIHEAIQLSERIDERMTLALGHQWSGTILAARGRHQKADRAFRLALGLLVELNVPRRLAECHRQYAEVLYGRADHRGAVEHLRMAAELWQPAVDDMSGFVDGSALGGVAI